MNDQHSQQAEGIPSDDGLPIPEVGRWARQKYHLVSRYLRAFTTAMRNKWSELHYIDLFCGPGVSRIRGSNELAYASPMLAAMVEHPFTCLHLCDAESANVEAACGRIERIRPQQRIKSYAGDANQLIEGILGGVPDRGALSVTFADPYGLHFDFESARTITSRRSDLLVLLPDRMDAMRNWAAYYLQNPDSNLDKFMGESGWRDLLASSPTDRRADRLVSRYEERLRELGHAHTARIPIKNDAGQDIYVLVFASQHEAGIRIWRNISRTEASGQRLFDMD